MRKDISMLGYSMLGSNDIPRAKNFYDPLCALMGIKTNALTSDKRLWYSKKGEMTMPMLAVAKPFDGKPASVGNGVMVALPVRGRELVDQVHAKAIAQGGTDEGKPGMRGDHFYGAYFRDPDGNKLCIFTMV
jgi:predicted lactoylglutathione lyase